MTDLVEFAIDTGPAVYYSDSFLKVVEDHLTYLREHNKTFSLPVTPLQASQYRFDLRGLLNELGVSPRYHYIVMRMNYMTSFDQVSEDLIGLLVPDENIITTMASLHMAETTL